MAEFESFFFLTSTPVKKYSQIVRECFPVEGRLKKITTLTRVNQKKRFESQRVVENMETARSAAWESASNQATISFTSPSGRSRGFCKFFYTNQRANKIEQKTSLCNH